MFFAGCLLSAQPYRTITGTVSNADGDYLQGAAVLLYAKTDTAKIISYSIVDDKGFFAIQVKNLPDAYLIVSYLGYRKKKVWLLKDVAHYDIELVESTENLKPVTVTVKRLKDTIQLKRDTVKFSKDATLKELLKDNPDVAVGDDNSITFRGVPIDKILIDKKTVFVNQNSAALENITNEMIDKMQVINNYKDKFNVDFNNFHETVLNLDVKKKFRGVLKNIVQTGAGIKHAYAVKLNSFFFSDQVNLFSIQNTNTILDKSENKDEITDRQAAASPFYDRNVYAIASGLNNVKKDFYDNTYLSLKKETKKARWAVNLGFNAADQKTEKRVSIADDDQIPRSEESNQNKRKGQLFYGDFSLKKLLGKDFSIQFYSKSDGVAYEPTWDDEKRIFSSVTSVFQSHTHIKSQNFVSKNEVRTQKLIDEKWLWKNSVSYFLENTKDDYALAASSGSIRQNLRDRAGLFDIHTAVSRQKSSLFTYGLGLAFTSKNERIDGVDKGEYPLKRRYQTLDGSVMLRGDDDRLRYAVQVDALLYAFKRENKFKIPVYASFHCDFSSKKSGSISYSNRYFAQALKNSMDSLYWGASDLVLSGDFSHHITQRQELSLFYDISNVARERYLSFSASGTLDRNFLQTNLVDFKADINTYERRVFDERKTLFLDHGFSKGFYFSKQNHLFRVGYQLSGSLSESHTIRNKTLLPLRTAYFDIGLDLSLEPQHLFFSELALTADYAQDHFFIDGERVNRNDTYVNTVRISQSDGKHIFSIEFYNGVSKTPTERVIRNDMGGSYRFYFAKKASVFIKGENLLNLLGLNDEAGYLSTSAANGMNITTIRYNSLGYCIVGIQLKL